LIKRFATAASLAAVIFFNASISAQLIQDAMHIESLMDFEIKSIEVFKKRCSNRFVDGKLVLLQQRENRSSLLVFISG
jgi:hypothetical protein